MCVSLFVFVCLVLLLPFAWGFRCLFFVWLVFLIITLFALCFCLAICLGFCFSACFHLFFSPQFFPFIAMKCSLQGLESLAWSRAWASVVEVLSPGWWTTREFPAPENIPRGLHLESKTRLHSTTCRFQCWIPLNKHKQDRNTNLPISRQAA